MWDCLLPDQKAGGGKLCTPGNGWVFRDQVSCGTDRPGAA